MNSREKGKRGERQWRDELRANGYAARRGQQFSGGAESPDVVCDSLPWIHFEVKAVERLNVQGAVDQAIRDSGGKVPIVAHKRGFRQWLVTMEAETFFKFLRGDCTEASGGNKEGLTTDPPSRETTGFGGQVGADGRAQMANGQTDFKGPGGPAKQTETTNQ